MREFGSSIKEMDHIDEVGLGYDELLVIIGALLFDGNTKNIPHPEMNWPAFISAVKKQNNGVDKFYDPISKRLSGWINEKNLIAQYKAANNSSQACTIC